MVDDDQEKIQTKDATNEAKAMKEDAATFVK